MGATAEVNLSGELVGDDNDSSVLGGLHRDKATHEINGDHFPWVSCDNRVDVGRLCWLICYSLTWIAYSDKFLHLFLHALPTKPAKETGIRLLHSQVPSHGRFIMLADELPSKDQIARDPNTGGIPHPVHPKIPLFFLPLSHPYWWLDVRGILPSRFE